MQPFFYGYEMLELNRNRIYVKDGGVSTALRKACAGSGCEICELLNVKNPLAVEKLHQDYVAFGADIITTNTFGTIQLPETQQYEICFEGAKLACKVADLFAREVLVAGSIGVFPDQPNYLRKYQIQAEALCEGGADFIFIESIWDLALAKTVVEANVEIVRNYKKRIAFSITVGEDTQAEFVEKFVSEFEIYNPLFLGINCSNEPESIVKFANRLSELTDTPLLIAPNAGIPDANGNCPLKPERFLDEMKPLIDSGKFSIIGGCCGTTPAHIKLINDYIRS